MIVKFQRKHNRNLKDIYEKAIQPKEKEIFRDSLQKMSIYCRQRHTWKTRTGALESSITFKEPEFDKDKLKGELLAGGWGRAKYTYDRARRSEGRKKQYRRQRDLRIRVRRGIGIWVNYAPFVEKKGYPVLKQGIDRFLPRLSRKLGMELKAIRI